MVSGLLSLNVRRCPLKARDWLYHFQATAHAEEISLIRLTRVPGSWYWDQFWQEQFSARDCEPVYDGMPEFGTQLDVKFASLITVPWRNCGPTKRWIPFFWMDTLVPGLGWRRRTHEVSPTQIYPTHFILRKRPRDKLLHFKRFRWMRSIAKSTDSNRFYVNFYF